MSNQNNPLVDNQSSHICDSLNNLQNILADLNGFLVQANCLNKFDDITYAVKVELAENEIKFLQQFYRQIPIVRGKITEAVQELDLLKTVYEESTK